MTRLNWLHLSDWHQKGRDFDRTVVLDALLADIRQRKAIDPSLEKVDFVVFSGDLAYQGQAQEYETARERLLDPVLEALGLKPDRLFMVPGNHDMDRDHIYKRLPPDLQAPFKDDALAKEWLEDEELRTQALGPFKAYRAFVAGYTGQASPDYAAILRLNAAGKTIALLGINSAWLCARHKDGNGEVDDARHLVVGEPQIHAALEQIKDAEVKIAVLHHPFDWLADFDRARIESRLGRDCHFILRGHEHQPQVHVVNGTGGHCVVIPAGASYDRRVAENPRYTNAYNWVSLDFASGSGTVYLRRWSEQLGKWIEDIEAAYPNGQFSLNSLPKNLATPATDAPPTSRQIENERPNLEAYCKAAESQHREIPLAGFKTRLRVPIDLEELYVPLQAMVDLRGTGDSRFADAADAEAKLRAHGSPDIALIHAFREAQARKRRNLVILGDPGSGKTTHLKRLLLACLRQAPESLGLPKDTLPVFLPLRELEDLNHGIAAFIEKTLDSPHLDMPNGFGRQLLKRGHLLLLFDGLDEVSDPKQRAKVAHWIEDAVKVRDDCAAVVTCRFAGYDEASRLNERFLELHLRPLTPEQSESFIRNWYKAVETGLSPGPSGEVKAKASADELIERLKAPDYRSTRMAEMTRNPLLLANLCLVHRDRGGILPQGRHALYDECVDVLLERWREGDKHLSASIPAEKARRVLQPAALWLHGEEGRTRASADELAPVLEPALKAAQWRDGDARQFLQTLRDESGLLTGWSGEHYGFMHLGFQEYLAACELRRLALAEALQSGQRTVLAGLAGHYGASWWQEVILLVLAQGNPALFAPFMAEALKQPRFAEDSAFLDLILEEAAEFSPVPFVELLRQEPGASFALWASQVAAMRVLQRLNPDALEPLIDQLTYHPVTDICTWAMARTQKIPPVFRNTFNGHVELLHIPGGRFTMGSPKGKGYDHERPAHEVEIRPFYLGRYPVTNEEYARFLKANPDEQEPKYWADRRFNQARQPVVGVDWEQARRFAHWAGGRLATEAEWEYACRAGSASEYFWGDSDAEIGEYAWYSENSQDATHPVGEKRPNAFGLHDMAGNVWEWTQDRWHDNYDGAPVDGSAWDSGAGRRVIRGGSWSSGPDALRSAFRFGGNPDNRDGDLGFRLAQDL